MPDVAPVGREILVARDAVRREVVRVEARAAREERRDDRLAEVVRGVLQRVVLERLDQDARAEDVVAHRRERELRAARASRRGSAGFSSKPTMRPSAATSRTPNREASAIGTGNRGDRQVVPALLVDEEHRVDVHHVDVVAAEDADVLGLLVEDEVEVLVDGVRRARGTSEARGASAPGRGRRTGRCRSVRRQVRMMCSMSEFDLNCVRTLIFVRPELTKLFRTKSMIR